MVENINTLKQEKSTDSIIPSAESTIIQIVISKISYLVTIFENCKDTKKFVMKGLELIKGPLGRILHYLKLIAISCLGSHYMTNRGQISKVSERHSENLK